MAGPQIIGLVGRRHAGKDLVADYIKSRYGHENRKFAGAMKDALVHLFDFSREQVDGDLKEVRDERWGASPRTIMQFFGTEMMQYKLQECLPDLGRQFAVKRLFLPMNGSQQTFCVSDVRFPMEVDAIHERGGITIHIHRQGMLNKVDMHESEAGIDGLKCTHNVFNNGTKEELYEQIDSLMGVVALAVPGAGAAAVQEDL